MKKLIKVEKKETTKDAAGTELRLLEVKCSDGLCCDVCGGRMIYIRGRHPGMDNRIVCPTCMAEALDDIKVRLRDYYRRAY